MASSYSTNLKIELIGTGDQAGSWGTTTNGNLGTVLEEAIVGKATVNFAADADKTITMGNGPAASDARCIYLSLTSTGSLSATRVLTVPAIQKTYIVHNGTTGGQSITISSGIGSTVTVLNGKRAIVYVDGASVVRQFTDIGASTTIGGETIATTATAQTLTNKTLTAPAVNGGTVAQTVLTTPTLIEFGGAPYKTGTLSADIDTTNGSATVVVDIAANGATVGDYLVMAGATATGGIPAEELNRVNVITAVTTNTVSFTATTTATATTSGGGAPSYSLLPKIVPPSVPATLFGVAQTVTLTNKRITPRVNTVASAGTIEPSSDASDMYTVTALAVPATVAAPSGTPTNGQRLILRIKDNGTARALTWNAAYRAIGTVLPTTTIAGKTCYVGCIYNSADSVWDVVAVSQQV